MDMDLWWCPVCERAITEREEDLPPPMTTPNTSSKQRSKVFQPHTHSQERSHFTSRGGVYGPKGGLYCSDACRAVEELNGRRAFEELAACLSEVGDQVPVEEEPESEGTLSGTDDATTDRRRSLSLGRGSESGATSERTSGSSPGAPSVPLGKTWGLTPLAAELGTGFAEHTGLGVRRAPMLLAPNGTPLIQPTFPQRPVPGPNQRRHHSQYSQHQLGLLHATGTSQPAGAAKLAAIKGRLAPNTSNSVPTYAPSAVPGRPGTLGTKRLANFGRVEREEMEFGSEARHIKPTSLWQHYGLFYRSRSGSRQGRWAEWGSEKEATAELTRTQSLKTTSNVKDSRRKSGEKGDSRGRLNLAHRSEEKEGLDGGAKIGLEVQEEEEKRRLGMGVVPMIFGGGLVGKKDLEGPRRDWRTGVMEETKCSRSWSWDHLPADVPQYPAMDLERVRRSRIERIQKLKEAGEVLVVGNPMQAGESVTVEGKKKPEEKMLMDKEATDGLLSVVVTKNKLVQSRKKLFVFQ